MAKAEKCTGKCRQLLSIFHFSGILFHWIAHGAKWSYLEVFSLSLFPSPKLQMNARVILAVFVLIRWVCIIPFNLLILIKGDSIKIINTCLHNLS